MAGLKAPRRLLSATLLMALLWPSSTYAGFSPEPQLMTTLSSTILSATTGAGLGGVVLVEDRERHLRDHAIALLDALATGDKAHLLELATFYVEPAEREGFVKKLLQARRFWMAALSELMRGQRLASSIDRALVAL